MWITAQLKQRPRYRLWLSLKKNTPWQPIFENFEGCLTPYSFRPPCPGPASVPSPTAWGSPLPWSSENPALPSCTFLCEQTWTEVLTHLWLPNSSAWRDTGISIYHVMMKSNERFISGSVTSRITRIKNHANPHQFVFVSLHVAAFCSIKLHPSRRSRRSTGSKGRDCGFLLIPPLLTQVYGLRGMRE